MSGGASKPMEEEEIKSMVDDFCGVTSAGRDEALFFLESHNWNVDSAVQSFYDDPPPAALQPVEEERAEEEEEDDDVAEENEEEEEQDDEDYLPSENEDNEMEKKKKKKEKEKGNNRSGIKTISDLKRKAHSDSDTDSDSDSDLDGQDFYTGGEKSGMVVRDPSKRRKNSNKNRAEAIFEQARKMASRPGPSKKPGSNSKSFKGKARTLAGEETPSENPSYDIYFWRNGFTVNNGPLRAFNDPQNASFLESIKKSECPEELKPSDGSSEIGVNLVRKESNYPVPKKRGKQNGLFRGKARTIGEEGPSETSPTPVLDTPPILSSTPTPPVPPVQLEASLPTTSLQIRLTDGTRLVSRFNLSNTIGDIRAFSDASRPGGTNIPYRLQTVGFPPKQLDDVSMTIQELGIENSVVIQNL